VWPSGIVGSSVRDRRYGTEPSKAGRELIRTREDLGSGANILARVLVDDIEYGYYE
jgi:hypothetical protein